MNGPGALILAAALVSGGARASCGPGLHNVTTAQIFFGLDVGADREIGASEWRSFLDAEVTPRFPDGLSVWDVAGQWKDPAGQITREPAKALLIVLSGAPGEDARLKSVIDAYKSRFHQQSVLLLEQTGCAAF